MYISNRLKSSLICGVSAVGLFTGSTAFADNNTVEEIVVTAQKRAENLQDVPITVDQISPKDLQNAGVLKTEDLQNAVAGMSFSQQIDEASVFIRGVGPEGTATGEESSVATYLDDLYIPSEDASIFNLSGVDNIEVLKGPQGTLFGRNATGGVIQVKTKDPQFTPEVDAHFGYGNYDTKSGDFYATGAIIPGVLAGNITIYANNEADGWGRDVVTGDRAFTSNEFGGRIKLLATPFDGTKIKLSISDMYQRGEEGFGFNQVQGLAPIPGLLPPPTGAKFVGWYNTEDVPNDVGVNRIDIGELRIDQETPVANVVSITGWQRFKGYSQFNQDGVGLVQTHIGQVDRTISEELQVLSRDDASYASWFKWIFGAFYMHDKAGYDPALLGGPAFGVPSGVYALSLSDQTTTTSWAGFAQGTFSVTSDTHVTTGFRYSVDNRVFEGGTQNPDTGQPIAYFGPGYPGANRSWYLRTYRFSLDHQFTDDLMAYFSFNRGVKSGQFDTFGTALTGPIATPPVDPETLYAYEVGIKSELFEHRLRLNADAFHYSISNLQLVRIVSGGTKLLNAASAEIDGIEMDLTAKPLDHLSVSGGLSYDYGHYSSFPNAPDYFVPTQTFDATGAQTIRTPRFSSHVTVDYIITEPFGDFDVNASLAHMSPFNWTPDGSLKQPLTNIVNASVSWTDPSGSYDVRLWGNNIFGDKYYSYGSETAGFGEQFSPAPPATFGITLGYHFQ